MEPGIWNLLSLSCPQQPRQAILESGIWNLLCALVNAPRRSELESGNWNLPFWNFGPLRSRRWPACDSGNWNLLGCAEGSRTYEKDHLQPSLPSARHALPSHARGRCGNLEAGNLEAGMCKNRPTVTNTATKVERLPGVHLARVARSRQHPVLNVTPELSHRLLRSVAGLRITPEHADEARDTRWTTDSAARLIPYRLRVGSAHAPI